MQCILCEQKRSWSWSQTVLYMQSLCLYILNFICALAHVLCILSPRPEVIAIDVKLRERKTREPYPWRKQDKSPVRHCFVGLYGYNDPSPPEIKMRGPQFSQGGSHGPSGFHPKNVYMKQKLADDP